MGLKRKASSLESDYTSFAQQQQQPSSPPSMTFSSTTSSPDSMVTEPFHSTFNYHLPPSTNAPWLNSRTRKRVRDNRPDELQIHSDTVRKLFEAQKPHHHQQEDAMMMDGDDFYNSNSLPSPPVEEDMLDSTEICDELPTTDLLVPEANQRSLHDFFRRQPHHQTFPPTPPAFADSMPVLCQQQIFFQAQPPAARPPTPQEISAGAPAPVLRERPSMGFLGEINTTPPPERADQDGVEAQSCLTGGILACGFRSKAEIEATLIGGEIGFGTDAMVMG